LDFRERVERTKASHESLMPFPYPMTLWFGNSKPKRLFYFTKAAFLHLLWKQSLFPEDWLVIERPSIPTHESLIAARQIAQGFKLPIVFFGDLRPLDLTVFALLRRGSSDFSTKRVVPLPIRFCGINDPWLALADEFRRPGKQLQELRMSRTEREQFELSTELIPDLQTLVGERSFNLLRSGQQVYLEMTYNIGGYRKGYTERLVDRLNAEANRASKRLRTG
jgi:hypothetical protein